MISRPAFRKCLLAAGLLALVLRAFVCFQLAHVPSVASPSVVTDMATYLRLAKEICAGKWPDHFDYQPFYYSVFLPFCRLFSADSLWPVWVFQTLAGAASCLLAGMSAARLYGRKAGLASALLLSLNQIHVFYTPFALLEVLQGFWMSLFLFLVLWCWKRNRPWQWCLASLVLAAATLTRGNALLILPGLLALSLWRNWHSKIRAAGLLLAMFLLFEAPQLPFAIRNYHYTGRWCGPSTAGEKVLALGNTPEAPAGGLEYPLTYHRWVADAEKRPEEGRISVLSRILEWAGKEPLVFAELKFRSLLLFWDRREIPNNVSLEVEGQHCLLTRFHLLLPFAVLGPLALLGLWVLLGRWHYHNPCQLFLLYLVAMSWTGTALFYNLARFRLASLPLLAVAGGIAIAHAFRLHRLLQQDRDADHARSVRMKTVLKVLLAIFLCCAAYSQYQSLCEASVQRMLRPNGVHIAFQDTELLYDHGPIVFGGLKVLGLPPDGLQIEKTFVLPDPSHKKYIARLAYLPPHSHSYPLQLRYHGKIYQPKEPIKDRLLTWAEVPLELVPGDTAFTWILPPSEEAGFAIDEYRDYARTTYQTLSGQKMLFFAEAFAELQSIP